MNSIAENSRRHDVTFHSSGQIDISARVARILNLMPGDVIDVLVENSEWYLSVKLRHGQYCGRHHGTCFATSKSGKGTLRAWSKPIASQAIRLARAKSPLRCPCGDVVLRNGLKLIIIINRRPLL